MSKLGVPDPRLLGHLFPGVIARLMEEKLAGSSEQTAYVIAISGLGTFEFGELCGATRRAFASGRPAEVRSVSSPPAQVRADTSGVVIFRGDVEVPLPSFATLSPVLEQRLSALRRVQMLVGPFVPSLDPLLEADARALTDQDLRELIEALTSSVPALQDGAAQAVRSGTATMDLLFPVDASYYEEFCGPDPRELSVDQYLSTRLVPIRQRLLTRDLRSGLRVAAVSYVDDALAPGEWLDGWSDDDLWTAIVESRLDRDPFSVLASLDIAAHRLHDARFAELAAVAVERLRAESFPSKTGHDVYALIATLFTTAKRSICLVPELIRRPPYWRRMSALMQAITVAQTLDEAELDPQEFGENLEARVRLAGTLVNLLDLRAEPLYQNGWESPGGLRAGVLGLALAVESRHLAAGREIPSARSLQVELAKLAPMSETGGQIVLPGPLRGAHRGSVAIDSGDALPSLSLAQLALLSFVRELPSDIVSAAGSALESEAQANDDSAREKLQRLALHAAVLASTTRNARLADTIASALIGSAGRFAPTEVLVAAQILLVASAACGVEGTPSWLEERLYRFARTVDHGQAAWMLYRMLGELDRILPLKEQITGRAKAASLAASPFN